MKLVLATIVIAFLVPFLCSCRDKTKPPRNADVPKKRTQIVETPDGPVEATVTTVAPVPQEILKLTPDELKAIQADASRAAKFIAACTQSKLKEEWELKDLDEAFAIWGSVENANKLSEQEVMNIVGSAFGEYCVKHLKMKWVKLKDQYGTNYAIRSQISEVMGFPHSTVQKRIESKEHSFMVPVFFSIKQMLESGEYKETKSTQ